MPDCDDCDVCPCDWPTECLTCVASMHTDTGCCPIHPSCSFQMYLSSYTMYDPTLLVRLTTRRAVLLAVWRSLASQIHLVASLDPKSMVVHERQVVPYHKRLIYWPCEGGTLQDLKRWAQPTPSSRLSPHRDRPLTAATKRAKWYDWRDTLGVNDRSK